MKKWYVITGIVSLAMVAAVIYGVVVTNNRDALYSELKSVYGTLASTQSELNTTKQTLVRTQSELSTTTQTLASTQADLSSTKQSLAARQAELTSTNQKLSSVQSDLSSIKTKMDAIEAKLNLYESTTGVKIYSSVQPRIERGDSSMMQLKNNANATNPSWQQLISFLISDTTDDNSYNINSFDCVDFAETLHNNAEVAGIKAAFVAVNFENDPEGHAVNAFVTTDRGLVYVDDTVSDTIAYLAKDKELGFISLGQNTKFDYAYYEKMAANSRLYDLKLAAYNKDVQTYNAAYEAEQIRRARLTPQQRLYDDIAAQQRLFEYRLQELRRHIGPGITATSPLTVGTLEWFDFMETSIDAQKKVLDSLQVELKDFNWLPMGIVKSIEIYW